MKIFSYVLDASALLAVMNREPGMEQVQKLLPESCISSVNFSEVAFAQRSPIGFTGFIASC